MTTPNPSRVIEFLTEVADPSPKGTKGPWQYGDGEPMQADAAWALQVLSQAVGTPVAIPHGWSIFITGGDEVVVRAPGADPGGMTIPSGGQGTLSVRLLDALCRAMVGTAESTAGLSQE